MSLNFDWRIPPGKRGEGRNTMGSERGKWEKPEESEKSEKWEERAGPAFGDGRPGVEN